MTNRGHPAAVSVLRRQQETDPIQGGLFRALHTFADRVRKEWYANLEGCKDLPYPVVSMEKDKRSRLGYYVVKDGYALINRINLNPFALRTGTDAAETLAHEMVHLWQFHVGRPCRNNYHGREFHEMMERMGIISSGRGGYHADFTDTWHDWMLGNEDLQLSDFILPGMDAVEPRKMKKLQCLECGNSFRNRRFINVQCLDCDVPFQLVAPGKKKVAR